MTGAIPVRGPHFFATLVHSCIDVDSLKYHAESFGSDLDRIKSNPRRPTLKNFARFALKEAKHVIDVAVVWIRVIPGDLRKKRFIVIIPVIQNTRD